MNLLWLGLGWVPACRLFDCGRESLTLFNVQRFLFPLRLWIFFLLFLGLSSTCASHIQSIVMLNVAASDGIYRCSELSLITDPEQMFAALVQQV